MRTGLLLCVLSCLWIWAPDSIWAQQPGHGTIHGRVTTETAEGLVAYGLVQLLSVPDSDVLRSTLSDSTGRFVFAGVPAGSYRLRVDRIGYSAEPSSVFVVAPGTVVEQDVASVVRPVEIAGLVVGPPRSCYTGTQIPRDPRLSSLWEEARKGIETRAAFERQFAYTYRLWQITRTTGRRASSTDLRIDTIVTTVHNKPRSTGMAGEPLAERDGRRLGLRLPSEQELLAAEFLRTHCLMNHPGLDNGSWELQFRPVRHRRNKVDIRGSVRLDGRTFQVQAVTLEYLFSGRPFIHAVVNYADTPLPGGSLRLPRAGTFVATPTRGVRFDHASINGVLIFSDYAVSSSLQSTL